MVWNSIFGGLGQTERTPQIVYVVGKHAANWRGKWYVCVFCIYEIQWNPNIVMDVGNPPVENKL